ncbi:hypothetical protein V1478_008386 [Vespula squamosa]|uniref:Uncharacterized protein n=1 Tax=Vespula squamosa TaxID=30214 RepID=A0ABD2ATC6_VESSQ
MYSDLIELKPIINLFYFPITSHDIVWIYVYTLFICTLDIVQGSKHNKIDSDEVNNETRT